MIISDVFRRYRKTESLPVHIIRIIFVILLLGCLTLFTINTILSCIYDQPVVSYSLIKDDMPVPAIQFFSEEYFLINCYFSTPEVNESTGAFENNACNRHITEPSEKNGSYYNGYFTFPFNSNFKLLLMRNRMAFLITHFNSSSNILFKAYDSEYINLKNYTNGTFSLDNSPFSQSIEQLNTYEIKQGQSYSINFSRRIRKSIIPNWKATLGIAPDYERIPYLSSRISIDINFAKDATYMSDIDLRADFNVAVVETEIRLHAIKRMNVQAALICRTEWIEHSFFLFILNSLSLIGGAWTFSVVIYKLLFGDDAIQPFGIIHKYGCCLRNRTMNNLRKSLITLPLINNIQNSHLTIDNDEISIEQLESEINALEIFLKDYVISAKQLENLYESIEKSKDQ